MIPHQRCRCCRKIGNQRAECEFCGASDLEEWPEPEIDYLLAPNFGPTLNFNLNDQVPFRASVLTTAIAFECLLTDLICLLIAPSESEPRNLPVVKALLDSYRGADRMFSLFKRLRGQAFEEEAHRLGFDAFVLQWKEVIKVRNWFAHTGGRTENPGGHIELYDFARDGLKLFRLIHNQLVA